MGRYRLDGEMMHRNYTLAAIHPKYAARQATWEFRRAFQGPLEEVLVDREDWVGFKGDEDEGDDDDSEDEAEEDESDESLSDESFWKDEF